MPTETTQKKPLKTLISGGQKFGIVALPHNFYCNKQSSGEKGERRSLSYILGKSSEHVVLSVWLFVRVDASYRARLSTLIAGFSENCLTYLHLRGERFRRMLSNVPSVSPSLDDVDERNVVYHSSGGRENIVMYTQRKLSLFHLASSNAPLRTLVEIIYQQLTGNYRLHYKICYKTSRNLYDRASLESLRHIVSRSYQSLQFSLSNS